MSRGGRRIVIVLGGVIVVLAGAWLVFFSGKAPELDPKLWDQYRARFITADGRVVDKDTDPKGITHSEGQGYGMLLAEAAGDREHFDRIWQWTQSHLRRPDGLFSWKFAACGRRGYCIADENNASDGDILIAWALLRAGKDWGRKGYVAAAREIAKSVSDKLIVSLGKHTLLLPAADGFSDQSGCVVNLSYWIFPAFNAFAETFHDPLWRQLSEKAPALLQEARFGKWQLPPDWLYVGNGSLRPADKFPPRYSFDAVRIPLYLVWGDIADKNTLAPFLSFWSARWPQGVPAWVDLKTDAVAPFAWSSGVASIARLAERMTGAGDGQAAELPTPGSKDGYYSWSLALLTRVAAAETRTRIAAADTQR
jgi:endoglucanase